MYTEGKSLKVTKTIAITGGPGSGKTTILAAIRNELGGLVHVVPEMASILLKGFPRPGHDVVWSQGWQDTLQRTILAAQIGGEEAWQYAAQQNGAQIILCDRGVLDGVAYYNQGCHEFCKDFGLDRQQVYCRYVGVVHLQTLAEFSASLYESNRHTNPERFENAERAVLLDRRLRDAWCEHPNYLFVEAGSTITHKIEAVWNFVHGFC